MQTEEEENWKEEEEIRKETLETIQFFREKNAAVNQIMEFHLASEHQLFKQFKKHENRGQSPEPSLQNDHLGQNGSQNIKRKMNETTAMNSEIQSKEEEYWRQKEKVILKLRKEELKEKLEAKKKEVEKLRAEVKRKKGELEIDEQRMKMSEIKADLFEKILPLKVSLKSESKSMIDGKEFSLWSLGVDETRIQTASLKDEPFTEEISAELFNDSMMLQSSRGLMSSVVYTQKEKGKAFNDIMKFCLRRIPHFNFDQN